MHAAHSAGLAHSPPIGELGGARISRPKRDFAVGHRTAELSRQIGRIGDGEVGKDARRQGELPAPCEIVIKMTSSELGG